MASPGTNHREGVRGMQTRVTLCLVLAIVLGLVGAGNNLAQTASQVEQIEQLIDQIATTPESDCGDAVRDFDECEFLPYMMADRASILESDLCPRTRSDVLADIVRHGVA